MAKEDKTTAFTALTFKEQQEKWMAFRSQPLQYEEPIQTAPPSPQLQPNVQQESAPIAPASGEKAIFTPFKPRHHELDRVYQKHVQALKNTAVFTAVPRGE